MSIPKHDLRIYLDVISKAEILGVRREMTELMARGELE